MQNCLLIATLRIRANLSQKKMATLLGVSEKNYQDYEVGCLEMNLEQLNILSNYFNVSLNALLNLTSNTKNYAKYTKINYRMLAYYLKYMRMRYNLTQDKLSGIFNISRRSISRYENYPKSVSLKYLVKFCTNFHVSLDYICGKTSKKEV